MKNVVGVSVFGVKQPAFGEHWDENSGGKS